MAQPAAARSYTAEEVRAMQDESRAWPGDEVIDGELFVTPAPRTPHQMIVTELLVQLGAYPTPLGRRRTVFASPSDISWGPKTLVQPDVVVVGPEEISRRWSSVTTRLLATEAPSPSSVRADRVRKRTLYMEHGVRTYWIVDDVLRWRVTTDAPELVLPLGALFDGLPGE